MENIILIMKKVNKSRGSEIPLSYGSLKMPMFEACVLREYSETCAISSKDKLAKLCIIFMKLYFFSKYVV